MPTNAGPDHDAVGVTPVPTRPAPTVAAPEPTYKPDVILLQLDVANDLDSGVTASQEASALQNLLGQIYEILPNTTVLLGDPTPSVHSATESAIYTGSGSASSSTSGLGYARMIRLQYAGSEDGTLLATFEDSNNDGSITDYHIQKSTDNGATGIAIREWLSFDHGASWTYVGVVQSGGGLGDGVYEPFVTVDSSGHLAMLFSDERQNATYSQFIGEVISTDGGLTWSANSNGVSPRRPRR